MSMTYSLCHLPFFRKHLLKKKENENDAICGQKCHFDMLIFMQPIRGEHFTQHIIYSFRAIRFFFLFCFLVVLTLNILIFPHSRMFSRCFLSIPTQCDDILIISVSFNSFWPKKKIHENLIRIFLCAHVFFGMSYMFSIVCTHQPIFTHSRISFLYFVYIFVVVLFYFIHSVILLFFPVCYSLNSFDTCSTKRAYHVLPNLFENLLRC